MTYLKAHRDLWVDSASTQVGQVVDDDDAYTVMGFTQDAILNILPTSSKISPESTANIIQQ